MKLYLDDNLSSPLLVRILQNAGHDVQIPIDVGLAGRSDPVHMTQGIHDDRAVLTEDYKDFEEIHFLIREAGGHHSGILAIRKNNDPKKDLTPVGIVRALRNLIAAGVPIRDQYVVLNHWR